jgi:hypothetical protein
VSAIHGFRRAAVALGVVAGAGLLAPAPASAHGLVGRADLPIPAEGFGVAAAGVLVVSFVLLAFGWTRPRLQEVRERPLVPLPPVVDAVLGTVGLAAFVVTAYAALAGTSSQLDNLAPTIVYVVFWVGVPFASLLFGDVFRLLSPWRALGRAVGWMGTRVLGAGMPEPLPYPERLGYWPAAAGVLAFGICELCWATAREPLALGALMLLAFAIQLVGMSLYGVEPWTRRGDAFGVYFGLFARLAVFVRREGMLCVRPPVAGATSLPEIPGVVALLVTAIGVTAFDGAKEGPLFNDAVPVAQDAFMGLGFSTGNALGFGFLLGLLLAIGVIAAIYWLAIEGMPLSRRRVGLRFAHALIPIAAAYVVAHYFSLLAYQGQDLLRLVSDPLGDGSDLFKTAGRSVDYTVVSATTIWYVQVLALITGHVAALVLGHDRALVLYGSSRAAARSQIVMLVLMVCFTCLGLYLLSVANA